jgi:hypothetical protein
VCIPADCTGKEEVLVSSQNSCAASITDGKSRFTKTAARIQIEKYRYVSVNLFND